MCGIAGIHGLEGLPDPFAVGRRMTDAIAHRGPDAQGLMQVGNTLLGHRRLSIIDPAASSNQPFSSADGRFTLAYNGEIYNYRELRAQLDGVSWRTRSDTEVLVEAFARWGSECLHRLHGMFAFAVHDAATNELFIARDRMGVKPLYWYRDHQRLLFASELRALLASGLVPRRIDQDALVDHLRYQTVHAPATLVHGVRMLQAGHWLRVGDQDVQEQRWYDLAGAATKGASDLPIERVRHEVRDRLSRAVEKRLVSDVPFGAFLSGGIDSSAVVGLMAQASERPVHTFSVVFDEEEFSEERFARLLATKFATEHTAIRLKPVDMLRLLPDALAAMDHPSADGANTYVVSKVTKEAGIKMALSGLGGDEVFAGYPVFKRTLSLWGNRWVSQFPLGLRVVAARAIAAAKPGVASDKLGELLRLPAFSVDDTYPISRLTTTDGALRELLLRDKLPANQAARILRDIIRGDKGHALPFLSQVSLGELATYLQSVLLRDADQMSMAHALEVRVPFLDHELVEFVLGVNDRLKYPHTPKQLLVDSLGDLLPREVVDRPKMGFTLPWELWMRNELKGFCTERLAVLEARPEFRLGAVSDSWSRFLKGDGRMNWSRLWSLVVLGDWLKRHNIE
jgi:asparagine synthase (glutamine-hydrolysing)